MGEASWNVNFAMLYSANRLLVVWKFSSHCGIEFGLQGIHHRMVRWPGYQQPWIGCHNNMLHRKFLCGVELVT